jgi:ribonuclease HI
MIQCWNLKVFCDSDWAGDPETRISVTGFIIYLQGAPVCWRSKAQKGVTLSSSEAEYVAISDALKEVKFLFKTLELRCCRLWSKRTISAPYLCRKILRLA